MLSGFSGLIYESIWTHYLKLLLGHAAYAQSLVLVIFMGGLALGAFIASKFIHRIKNALLAYAIAEALIGIAALFFHDTFLFINELLFNSIAINFNATWFNFSKWLLAALIILPQSILLGTTFPLISSGLIQHGGQKLSGKTFSLLYFNNSIGASIGAIASGFYLVQNYGLPGTITTAGWINIVVAIAVVTLVYLSKIKTTPVLTAQANPTLVKDNLYYLMLATAFFTGMASFIYEIAWIRMLTMVLGATTHAFELMISAFILGLALGSLWIKRRIDSLSSPLAALGYIQLLMAIAALSTLVFYEQLFDLMAYVFRSLNRTEEGYQIYMLVNHAFALMVMLPATFFAGMTLPLITNILFKQQQSDRVIGQVYAVNTVGAIIGVVVAMNILLPNAGTRGAVSLGALIDIAIGILIIGKLYFKKAPWQFAMIAITPLVIFQFIFQSSDFNPLKISSGVFRTGSVKRAEGTEVTFHRDGKLSTVNVLTHPTGPTILLNNGKPDASINLSLPVPTYDESTMMVMGALPVALNPEIKTVANIGMGSGQTVQTLLSYPGIKQVDTIEIEQAVIDSLPAFKRFSVLARTDPRSRIIVDDAKSFFSSSQNKYDLIVSEPSNPWVSGVASLFTSEFYQQIKKSLNQKGMLAQWLQLYEINTASIAQIIKSLSDNFKYYALYHSDDNNIIIIASDGLEIKNNISTEFLANDTIKKLLHRIKIKNTDDLESHYIGNKALLDPLFHSYPGIASSDYYPKLSYSAGKSLFLNESSSNITRLHHFPVPVHKLIDAPLDNETLNTTYNSHFDKNINILIAREILNAFKSRRFTKKYINTKLLSSLKLLDHQLHMCKKEGYELSILTEGAYQLVRHTSPYLGQADLNELWKVISTTPCYGSMPGKAKNWFDLYRANATANYPDVLIASEKIFNHKWSYQNEQHRYLVASVLLAAIKTDNNALARQVWERNKEYYKDSERVSLSIRLLLARLDLLS